MPLRLTSPTAADRTAVLALFETALAADPDYLPQVSAGLLALPAWFDAKPPDWARLAWDGRRLVGHVSVRRNQRLPGGAPVPDGLRWELGRLVVAPRRRRRGVGAALVGEATTLFGTRLWATCVAGGASHRLFTGLGWTDFSPVAWDDDPAPGVAVRARVR